MILGYKFKVHTYLTVDNHDISNFQYFKLWNYSGQLILLSVRITREIVFTPDKPGK